jgi:hypothetical protein
MSDQGDPTQEIERSPEKAGVGGSSPSLATTHLIENTQLPKVIGVISGQNRAEKVDSI